MDYFDTRTVVFAVAWLLLGGIMLLPAQTPSKTPRDSRRARYYDHNSETAKEK